MNALVPTYHAQLPEFLRDPALFASSNAALAGISSGAPPMISIRASKFRLVDPGGEEALVNSLTMSVIVLTGNEHVSKLYYAEAYNPADSDAKPPTCFSDNGVAPSSEAATPQAQSCAACPHAAWGSKITPAGTKIKACSDSKKLAVVLAVDTPIVVNGAASMAKAYEQVYLLRVPAASMGNFRAYGKSIVGRGIPLQGVITELSFDPEVDYPALLFKATGFVHSAATFGVLRQKAETDEVKDLVGANDRPLSNGAAAATASVTALPPPPAHLAAPAPAAAAVIPPTPPAAPLPSAPAPSADPAAGISTTRRRGRPPATVAPPLPAALATNGAAPAVAPLPPSPATPPTATASPTHHAIAPSAIIEQAQPAGDDLDALLKAALAP